MEKGQQLELFALETKKIKLPRFDMPTTDNARLMNYQADWLELGDLQAKEKLWLLSLEVARRSVYGIFEKRRIRLPVEDAEDKASDGVLYVMKRYENPNTLLHLKGGVKTTYLDEYGYNYCVLKDYISVIKQGVKHAIDYRTEADKIIDFVDDETLSLFLTKKEFIAADENNYLS